MKNLALRESRILIVDDQESNVLLLQAILEDNGYINLRTVTDSRQVLALVREFQPDLILLDLMMPYLDGFEVMEQLNVSLPADHFLPILVLTADIRAEAKQRALSIGAKDFLTKPFDQVEALLRIQNLLETRHLYTQLQNHNQILEQKIVERTDQIVQQSRLLELYFQHSLGGLALLDRDFNFLRVNAAYARADQRDVADFPGHNHFEFYPSDAQAIFEQVLKTKQPYQTFARAFEYAEHPERGVTFWDWSLVPILDANGEVELLLLSLNDVTERIRAEEALRASEKDYRVLVDNSPDSILRYDRNNRIRLLNRPVREAYAQLFGLDEKDVIGKTNRELGFPAEQSIVWEQDLQTVVSTGVPLEKEYLYSSPMGDAVYEWRGIPERDQDGNVQSVLCINRNITERKRMENDLRKSESRNRALVNAIPDLMFVLSRDGIFLDYKARIDQLYVPPEQFIGKSVANVIPPEIASQCMNAITGALGTGLQSFEYQLGAGATPQYFEARVDVNPDTREAVFIVRDITERKQAEEQIKQNAARAQALARIAARLNAQLDLGAVLNTVCEETAHALNAAAVGVSLYNPTQDMLTLVATWGLPPEYREHARPVPRTLYDENARRQGPILIAPDVQLLPELPSANAYTLYDIRTVVGASMLRNNQLVGVVSVYTLHTPRQFSSDELALLQGIADQAAQAITNARLYTDVEEGLNHLHSLREIDQAIIGGVDLRLVLKVVLDQVMGQLQLDAADILMHNSVTHTLDFVEGRGFRSSALRHTHLRLGDGYAGQAALERRIIEIPNLVEMPSGFNRAPLLAGEDFIAYFAVPLVSKGEVIGVMELFRRTPLIVTPEWRSFLENLSSQVAIALENSRLFNNLQRLNLDLALAYEATIEGWSRALDLRDKETEGHTLRVTEMTLRLARAAGMSDEKMAHLKRGALLHDIGKMGVPDGILLKPDKLTEEEWSIMRQHPTYAFELLLPIEYLRDALDIPYCHHEKWDGTGYPRGLKGEQIPLAARLFAIVDVWDALTNDRPYRQAWSTEKSLEHIRANSGTHFDPRVVELFSRMLSAEKQTTLGDR
jgi:PAS domain S-box-containing protein